MSRGNKTEHPLYKKWKSMRYRCRTKTSADYKNYGGRGIDICPEWDDFWVYVDDVESLPHAYEEGRSLDRANNDKGYWPWNVRWATAEEQQSNRRQFKFYGKGYTFHKAHKNRKKPWWVTFRVDGKQKSFGYFATEEEAKAKVLELRQTMSASRRLDN